MVGSVRWSLLAACAVTLAACSSVVEQGGGSATTTAATTTAATATVTTTVRGRTTTTGTATTSATSATSTTSTSTSTTTAPVPAVHDPACVVVVQPAESLIGIAARFDDETVDAATIQAENGLTGEVIHPGQQLDVCVGNGLDDITGEQRPEPDAALAAEATKAAVEVQQHKLNELFAGLGIDELLVDGISGPVTRQRLCAARLALGLPVSTADMAAGSEEEQVLMAATALPIPFTSSILSERWILIDQTCQIMFAGEGVDRLVFVFPTSTGEPGHETRPQDRTPVFRFDPANGNGGWHNSTSYPVPEDNPLNGNMYRPLYFDRGQAIHGANNVPTSPQSKGCARLRVAHQDALLAWLGLAGAPGPIGDRARIGVTVNVQGAYVPA